MVIFSCFSKGVSLHAEKKLVTRCHATGSPAFFCAFSAGLTSQLCWKIIAPRHQLSPTSGKETSLAAHGIDFAWSLPNPISSPCSAVPSHVIFRRKLSSQSFSGLGIPSFQPQAIQALVLLAVQTRHNVMSYSFKRGTKKTNKTEPTNPNALRRHVKDKAQLRTRHQRQMHRVLSPLLV